MHRWAALKVEHNLCRDDLSISVGHDEDWLWRALGWQVS
jgi:hypothetical protein